MNNDLYDRMDGIPAYRYPVYWDRRMTVEANLTQVAAWIAHYADKLPPGTFIDEVAILVPDPWHRARVSDHLQDGGWAKFNAAEDMVFTNPFGTRYMVEYEFFQMPGNPVRVELMMMGQDEKGRGGFSPLHQALLMPDRFSGSVGNNKYPMPHLSFKPKETSRKGYSQAVQYLMDNACIHAMTCQSTYGTFGYFLGNETMRQIYIKPRINMRDLV